MLGKQASPSSYACRDQEDLKIFNYSRKINQFMKRFFYFSLFFIGVFTLVLSCKPTPTEDIKATISQREIFLKGKSFEKVKRDYKLLTNDQQKALWVEKIEQLLTQNLPARQLSLISDLRTEILRTDFTLNAFVFNDKIKDIGIHLASITPREDFLNMFVSLESYTYNKAYLDKEICTECITDMQNEGKNLKNEIQTRTADCNCKWTCGWTGQSTSNCNRTDSGCGFLWLTSCTGRNCIDCGGS